jgi:hypothetical protein
MTKVAELRNSGRGLNFDGNDYIGIPNATVLNVDYITMEAIIYMSSFAHPAGSSHHIIHNKENSYEWGVAKDTGKLQGAIQPNWAWLGNLVVPLNKWIHVAIKWDGTYLTFFCDGQIETIDPANSGVISDTTNGLGIGARGLSTDGTTGASSFFVGKMREARLWNVARLDSDILNGASGVGGKETGLINYVLMNEGSGTVANDSSGNATNGTIYGATWVDEDADVDLMLGGELYFSQNYKDLYDSDPIASGRFKPLAGTWSYDSTNKWVKQTDSASNQKWGVQSDCPLMSRIKLNFDMVIESDPSTRIHSGAFIQTVDGEVTGYRVTHLDTHWIFSKWNKGAETSMTHTEHALSTIAVGQTVAVEVTHNFITGKGELKINGVLTLSWTDTSYSHGRAGFHNYGNVTRYDNLVVNDNDGLKVNSNGYIEVLDFSEVPDALSFDGVDDHISIPDSSSLSPSSAITIEVVQKLDALSSGTSSYADAVRKENSYILQWRNDGMLRPHIYIGAYKIAESAIGVVKTGVVQHISMTYDGAYLKGYVDVAEVSSLAVTGLITDSASTVFFGCFNGTAEFLDGTIYEIRIWNVARTVTELRDNRFKRLTGKEPGLVGLWRIDEGAGTVLNDATPNGNNGDIKNGASWVYSYDAPVSLSSDGVIKIKGELIEGVTF